MHRNDSINISLVVFGFVHENRDARGDSNIFIHNESEPEIKYCVNTTCFLEEDYDQAIIISNKKIFIYTKYYFRQTKHFVQSYKILELQKHDILYSKYRLDMFCGLKSSSLGGLHCSRFHTDFLYIVH